MSDDATGKKEKGESSGLGSSLKVPLIHTFRRRAKSDGAMKELSESQDPASNRSRANSTTDKEGNDVVSIAIGGKRPPSFVRRKSGKDAIRNVIGKVTRVSDDIAAMAVDIKEDTMDISKTAGDELGLKLQKSLCKDCSKMSFEQCIPGTGPTPDREIYEYIRPLERVILRREWCTFCRLIFQVLCRPENDPLLQPHVQNHIQRDLKGVSFGDWAEKATLLKRMFNSEAVWPFGLSREVPDGEAEVQKLFHPDDKNDESGSNATGPVLAKSSPLLDDVPDRLLMGALTAAKITMFGGSGIRERDLKILEGVDGALTAAMIFSANKRKRLPCWVLIKLHTRASSEAGLLAVHVAAHNREVLSPLAEVSRFHLRVATGIVEQSESGSTLRYGRILTENIDLSLGKEWLGACERHHRCGPLPPRGGRRGSQVANLRVIDLEKHRLHTCAPEGVRYAALSYVWGDYTYAKLDNRTIEKYFVEGALAAEKVNLPKAITDAMEVARGVGLQYLWVDALCIKQDDEAEKETQIGQMDKIYANAVVTIVAADGKNANSPLKGVSTERDVDQVVAEVRPGVNVLIPVPTGKSLAPWETRAWTLQEKLLSNRLIVFSGGDMIWHCREVVHFEDMTAKDAVAILGSHLGYPLLNFGHSRRRLDAAPFSSNSHDGTVSVVRSEAFQQYATLVADYTGRGMTYASDVLRALQGILPTLNRAFAQIQEGEDEVFRYGLPHSVLDVALLWQPEGKCERREHCANCKQPYMPSWSWAGWVGKNDYAQPFTVRTDSRGALRQLTNEDGVERIRPLVRFYARGRHGLSELPVPDNCKESTVTELKSPQSPVPRQGAFPQLSREVVEMGLLSLIESDETGHIWRTVDPPSNGPHSRPFWLDNGQIPEHWEASNPRSALAKKIAIQDVYANIDKWHLVFRTQISQFKLRWDSETQDNHSESEHDPDDEPDLRISLPRNPMPIWDANGRDIGEIRVHEPEKILSGVKYDFIILSEAQYFGAERSIDVVDFPLYNVMLVSGKDTNNVRTRLGLGKLFKHAWKLSKPADEVVVLG
ncbi:HET-domain-containing protein [Stipitochalara longipes BDJ]|nr:HET-domain-containing protein [Stipitochalara longipes BDJ]